MTESMLPEQTASLQLQLKPEYDSFTTDFDHYQANSDSIGYVPISQLSKLQPEQFKLRLELSPDQQNRALQHLTLLRTACETHRVIRVDGQDLSARDYVLGWHNGRNLTGAEAGQLAAESAYWIDSEGEAALYLKGVADVAPTGVSRTSLEADRKKATQQLLQNRKDSAKNDAYFLPREDGTWVQKGTKQIKISDDHLKPIGYTTSDAIDDAGKKASDAVLYQFFHRNTRALVTTAISLSQTLTSSAIAQLWGDYGFNCDKKYHALLNEALGNPRELKSLKVTGKAGWHGNTFLTQHETYGDQSIWHDTKFEEAKRGIEPTLSHGTLEGQKALFAKYLPNNSRLIASVNLCLASALLKPLSTFASGIHLYNDTTSLKSTCQKMGGGCWQDPNQLMSWDTSKFAYEVSAEAQLDLTMILEDLSHCNDGKAIMQVIYLLDGQGSTRGTKDRKLAKRYISRSYLLSSGEDLIEVELASKGVRLKGGAEVRLLSVPALVHGQICEDRKGYNTDTEFLDSINSDLAEHWGHAGPEFIKHLRQRFEDDSTYIDQLKERHRKTRERLYADLDKLAGGKARREFKRPAHMFATAILTGELCVEFGLYPPEIDSYQACWSLYTDWYLSRGNNLSLGARQVLNSLKTAVIHTIDKSNWRLYTPQSKSFVDRSQYPLNHSYPTLGGLEYQDDDVLLHIPVTTFKEEFTGGKNNASVIAELRQLKMETTPYENGKFDNRKYIDGRRVRCFTFSYQAIFQDSEDSGTTGQKVISEGGSGTKQNLVPHLQPNHPQSDASTALQRGTTTQRYQLIQNEILGIFSKMFMVIQNELVPGQDDQPARDRGGFDSECGTSFLGDRSDTPKTSFCPTPQTTAQQRLEALELYTPGTRFLGVSENGKKTTCCPTPQALDTSTFQPFCVGVVGQNISDLQKPLGYARDNSYSDIIQINEKLDKDKIKSFLFLSKMDDFVIELLSRCPDHNETTFQGEILDSSKHVLGDDNLGPNMSFQLDETIEPQLNNEVVSEVEPELPEIITTPLDEVEPTQPELPQLNNEVVSEVEPTPTGINVHAPEEVITSPDITETSTVVEPTDITEPTFTRPRRYYDPKQTISDQELDRLEYRAGDPDYWQLIQQAMPESHIDYVANIDAVNDHQALIATNRVSDKVSKYETECYCHSNLFEPTDVQHQMRHKIAYLKLSPEELQLYYQCVVLSAKQPPIRPPWERRKSNVIPMARAVGAG